MKKNIMLGAVALAIGTVTVTAHAAQPSQPLVEMHRCAAVYMIANTKFGGSVDASRWATKHNFLYKRAWRIALDNRTDPSLPMGAGYVPTANYYFEKSKVDSKGFERELVADLARCDRFYLTVDGAEAAENAGIGRGDTIQFQ